MIQAARPLTGPGGALDCPTHFHPASTVPQGRRSPVPPPLPSSWLKVEEAGGAAVVCFTTAALIADEVVESLGRQLAALALPGGVLVLDCAGVECISSTMLGH